MSNTKRTIFKKLGAGLIYEGQIFLKKAFNVQYTRTLTRNQLKNFLVELGIERNRILYSDRKYYVIDWKVMQDIIKFDFTERKKYLVDRYDCWISPDLAFAFGLFFADGSCSLRKDKGYGRVTWRIVNSNLDYLKRAKKGLEEEWKDLAFNIKSYPSYLKGKKTNFGERKKTLYCLDVFVKRQEEREPHKKYSNGGRKVKGKFIKEFRKLAYDFRKKIVPSPMFDHYPDVSKAFLEGVIAGDGCKFKIDKQKFYSPECYRKWRQENIKNSNILDVNRKIQKIKATGKCVYCNKTIAKKGYISVGKDNPRAVRELEEIMFCLGWENKIDYLPKEYRLYYRAIENNSVSCACDNYAESFKSHLAEIYAINSVALLRGVKVHIISENRDVYHRCNLILATEDNILKAFIFEAQSDGQQELKRNVPIQIGDWKYDYSSSVIDF